MAEAKAYQVKGAIVSVDANTGSGSIFCSTDQGSIQLDIDGAGLLMLRDQIQKQLAEKRHGGLYMLPAAEGCHGLEVAGIPPRLHIRLVLEDGKEGRLPIQEAALHRLNKIATDWFRDQDEDETT